MASGVPNLGFVYRYNIARTGTYGVLGTGKGNGLSTLAHYFPGYVFDLNVLAGVPAAQFPPGNFYPATLDAVRFTDAAAGDFTLLESSPYKGLAPGGADLGVDMAALTAAMAPPDSPPPPPSPYVIGARVAVVDTNALNVRSGPGTSFPTVGPPQGLGKVGTIVDGPSPGVPGGDPWVKVNYDTGTDGWSSTLDLDVVNP